MIGKTVAGNLITVAGTLLCGVLIAGERLAGGWIDSYNGPVEAYVLERDGEQLPVAIYMPLYVGDQIAVGQGYELTIGRSDGTVVKIENASGRHIVSDSDDSVTLLDNLMEWAGQWFGKYRGGNRDAQVVSMVSRGADSPPISMSLFPTGQARMLPGRRTLSLHWEGGKPPFGIRMRAVDQSEPLMSREGLKSGNAMIGPMDLRIGSYYMEVYDTDEVEIVRLDVVSPDFYPEKPAELGNANMPGQVLSTLEAMWLAGQGDGEWLLEAYQMVAASDGEPAAASVLRSAFEQGIVPVLGPP